jgi:CDP-diacylglycerol pyrophosphatase
MPLKKAAIASLALGAASFVHASAARADRLALWKIVHEKCVPDQASDHDPAPCAYVDLANGADDGYALLKDRVGIAQFLLIPTRRIPGIESPLLLEPGAPNYFGAAWDQRSYLFQRLHKELPRYDLSLAINSAADRSQDQLHIHIDCLRADVRDLLMKHAAEIGDTWSQLGFDLVGRKYRAMRLVQGELREDNPFKLLASGIPEAAANMGNETLVVVGAVFAPDKDGFIMLEDHVDAATGDTAHGEDVQDHTCTIAGVIP